MNNLREVKEDLLKDWITYREETILAISNEEDKKHVIRYDHITERILKNVPIERKKYVISQLDLLDKNYMEYFDYWSEKYYRNGFATNLILENQRNLLEILKKKIILFLIQ